MRAPRLNPSANGDLDIGFLHEIAARMSQAPPLHEVLREVMRFAAAVVECDSCFVYVLEKDELVLRASKNPHPEIIDRLKLKLGEGITGWVAEHREPAAVPRNAMKDPRFKFFNDLPEDRFEAFLSVPLMSRGRLVGVINLQNRKPHQYSKREISMISTVGTLVGAEIEMARLHRSLPLPSFICGAFRKIPTPMRSGLRLSRKRQRPWTGPYSNCAACPTCCTRPSPKTWAC